MSDDAEDLVLKPSISVKDETLPSPRLLSEGQRSLNSFSDSRGTLTVGQFPDNLPFPVKRFFFISDVPSGSIRGAHAHLKCEQFLVAITGSVKVRLESLGRTEEHNLDTAQIGLYIPPKTWGVQYDHSEDCVLLVLASHGYDEKEYITSYSDFKNLPTN